MKQDLINKLKEANEFVIVTHISPDADAISSSIGLAEALRILGKKVKVFFEEKIPEKFNSLVDASLIISSEEGFIEALKTSTLVGVDCATKKRLGLVVNNHFDKAKVTLNIDHHESNEKWAHFNWVIADAPATAYMVTELSKELGVSLTSNLASLLYSGIMDDTGCFCFANTTSDCLRVCADLIAAGAKPQKVSSILYFEVPERVIKLRAVASTTLETFADGKIALIYLTKQVLDKLGCTAEDTEGVIELVRSVEGAKVAFFAREINDGYKVSARSKDESIDVNKYAARYGGGGHKMASGFTLKTSLDEVLRILRTESLDLVS